MEVGEELHSYQVRRGRTSPALNQARDRLWSRFGVQAPYAQVVGRRPLVLEIGSGMGEATALMAAAEPDVDLLAVEVHPPGIAALLRRLEQAGLDNVRVADADALEVLRGLPERCLREVRLFFPDPWPKARHAKRRLVRPVFAELVATRLTRGGHLHLATDVPAYVEHARSVLEPRFTVEVVDRPDRRPVTGFERRGLAAGRAAVDLRATPRRT